MCTCVKVHGHIVGVSKPTSDGDENWAAINLIIESWFYSTCNTNFLHIIVSDHYTSNDLRDKPYEFFLKKKMPRMLQL